MLYRHHGYIDFDCRDRYFDEGVNEDAVDYLTLANRLVHDFRPAAVTIAGRESGMPGMCIPIDDGGIGFDYRLGMAIPTTGSSSSGGSRRGVETYVIPADKMMTEAIAYDGICYCRLGSGTGSSEATKQEDYEYFLKRSKSYKEYFDASTGFVRGKMLDGFLAYSV